MSLPKSEYIPDDPDLLPPARRRRARRLLAPLEVDERAIVLDQVRRRTSPSFDFFLFSVICGDHLQRGHHAGFSGHVGAWGDLCSLDGTGDRSFPGDGGWLV